MELVEDDVIESAQVEKGVDRARSRDANAREHRDDDFGDGEDDAAARKRTAVEELPDSCSSEALDLITGLVTRPFDDPLFDPGFDLGFFPSARTKPLPDLLAGVVEQILQQPLGRNDEEHM